jgi:hypothetical protein
MRSVRRGFTLCAFPLLAAVVAGGAALASGRDQNSGIAGRVVPCGIVLERPAPCAVPSASAGMIVAGRRQHVFGRAKVRADGSFRVRLDPGRYWLQPRTRNTRGPRTRATVSEGRWTTVTLVAGQVAPANPAQGLADQSSRS